ncbi:ATP-binding protein [Chitinimonas sp. PSY-7]|uniref:ATP-binding protein n=1 Tax=Chitinimonas sp. PSY-7 TaxID=3459088 RepID=UPI00404014DE
MSTDMAMPPTAFVDCVPPAMREMHAVVYALLTPDGRCIDANNGFYYLLGKLPGEEAVDIGPYLMHPAFGELAAKPDVEGAVLFSGLFNFVDSQNHGHSISGHAYRRQGNIELIGEHDIRENERLFDCICTLNEDLAAKQRELSSTQRSQALLLEKLKLMQSQLLQNEKMAAIGQLAAGIAHEINNPVGFISSNLHSLGKYIRELLKLLDAYGTAEPLIARDTQLLASIRQLYQACDVDFLREDIQQLVKESRDGLDRIETIVNNLKRFSHIDNAGFQMADIQVGLDETLSLLGATLRQKAEIKLEYQAPPLLMCNLPELKQVFYNLLINAAQAIETHGIITVRTGSDGTWAWVEVEDNGSGMSNMVLKRIFEPFFTTRPLGTGAGLGLAFSWGIVRQHQGKIDVDSQEGRGSRFRVLLPLEGPD